MAGEYRASFDFIETIGFAENYSPQKPYQSWGTEFIFVVENRENFISLQHILVMTVQNPDGEMSKPMTMKHWRQDWSYEDSQLNVYQGNNVWRMEQLSADSVRGIGRRRFIKWMTRLVMKGSASGSTTQALRFG